MNLIPLIAKADTFSEEELRRFRAQLRQDMTDQGIRTYHPMADPTAAIEDFYTAVCTVCFACLCVQEQRAPCTTGAERQESHA